MGDRVTGVLGSRLAVAIASVIVTAVVLMGGIAVASVANNSVTSSKIRNETIRARDIRTGAVKSAEIATGAVRGPEIAAGAVGASELKETTQVTDEQSIPKRDRGAASVSCPEGTKLYSWGYFWDVNTTPGLYVNVATASLRLTGGASVQGFNDTDEARTLSVRAFCIVA